MNISGKNAMIQNLVNAAAVLYEEPTLSLSPEGLRMRGMDPSHIAMLDVLIPPTDFSSYNVTDTIKFAIRTGEVSKILKRFGKEDEINVTIEDSYLSFNSEGKAFKIRTLEAAGGETPIPKLNLNAKIEADKDVIDKVLGDVQVLSEFVTIEAKEGMAHFRGKGDNGEAGITLSKEAISEIAVKEESASNYSLNYLSAMVKAVNVDKVVLEFSSKMPLKLTLGKIAYYLAPRVSD